MIELLTQEIDSDYEPFEGKIVIHTDPGLRKGAADNLITALKMYDFVWDVEVVNDD